MPPNTEAWRSVPLFGGAIVCELPEKFADVSKLRQVPDNQEVWMDKDGFTSIVIDILERLGPKNEGGVEVDGIALTEHLMDLVGEDADRVKVWNTTETEFTRLPDAPAYTLIATVTPPNKPNGKEKERESPLTAIILTLLRLEREKTDIVITVNVPHIKGEYDEEEIDLEMGKAGELIADAVNYSGKIWETFKIRDWGLFGGAPPAP
jgi:hypothetical protein